MSKFFKYFEERKTLAYSLIRIFIGVALFIRGFLFVSDPATVTRIAGNEQNFYLFAYLTIGHLIGGFLLAIGYFTRLASLIQIPILLGAVFVIHIKQGLLSSGQSLEISVLVLFLLIIFFLFGSGELSIESYLSKKK
ncbi:MAG: DoxX family protein [Ignavibacteria bacterium]